jgi:hypothetical protein
MRFQGLVAFLLVFAALACHPGPVLNTGPKQPSVGGTIAGIVRTSGGTPLVTRKVAAINIATGARYEASTSSNGGYTIQVPEGKYRLELELRAGEAIETQPAETEVNNSDLDSDRNFVLTVKTPQHDDENAQ